MAAGLGGASEEEESEAEAEAEGDLLENCLLGGSGLEAGGAGTRAGAWPLAAAAPGGGGEPEAEASSSGGEPGAEASASASEEEEEWVSSSEGEELGAGLGGRLQRRAAAQREGGAAEPPHPLPDWVEAPASRDIFGKLKPAEPGAFCLLPARLRGCLAPAAGPTPCCLCCRCGRALCPACLLAPPCCSGSPGGL